MPTISPTTPIAVFGATGNQGGAVVDALLHHGASVRALVRDTSTDKARALADRDVELARIDTDDPDTLTAALQGIGGFFFMTTPPGGMESEDTDGETRQGVALVDAATAAQVPHVVFSSVGGSDRHSGIPHFESKRRIEEHLEQSGQHSTVIRPVFFADNLAYLSPTTENGELVVRLPLPDGIKLQIIAVRDIGVIAASALLGSAVVPSGIEIAGDELTGSEIAAAYGERAGRPARYQALPIEALDAGEDMRAMFRWFAETPGYQADIEQVRSLDPDLWSLRTWLSATDAPPQ